MGLTGGCSHIAGLDYLSSSRALTRALKCLKLLLVTGLDYLSSSRALTRAFKCQDFWRSHPRRGLVHVHVKIV
jgi:hypothetical protein